MIMGLDVSEDKLVDVSDDGEAGLLVVSLLCTAVCLLQFRPPCVEMLRYVYKYALGFQ